MWFVFKRSFFDFLFFLFWLLWKFFSLRDHRSLDCIILSVLNASHSFEGCLFLLLFLFFGELLWSRLELSLLDWLLWNWCTLWDWTWKGESPILFLCLSAFHHFLDVLNSDILCWLISWVTDLDWLNWLRNEAGSDLFWLKSTHSSHQIKGLLNSYIFGRLIIQRQWLYILGLKELIFGNNWLNRNRIRELWKRFWGLSLNS